MDYSLSQASKRTRIHRQVIKALCDFNVIEYYIKGKRVMITEQGIRKLDDYYLILCMEKYKKIR
jgi:predicted transcriptional regulator